MSKSKEGTAVGSSNQSLDGDHCRCDRAEASHRVVSYRGSRASYRYHRCDCGEEWTERLSRIDRAEPITGDELLDIHLTLARSDLVLTDMF
jgi:hypothetical protein